MTQPPRNARYDDAFVLLPDVSQLLPGDILLTAALEAEGPKGLKQSQKIRELTGGSFSHALICSAPPTFVEAGAGGVSTISLARCFAHRRSNIRLLRFPDRAIAAKAASLAQLEIGRDYSISKAIASIIPPHVLKAVSGSGTFCSALVAQVYSSAGAEAFQAIPVEKTTPATLERLECLQDITDSVFRDAPAPNNIEAMPALDGIRTFSVASRQTEINKRYAKRLAPLCAKLASDYPEAGLEAPVTFFQVIQFVMTATERSSRVPAPRRPAFDAALKALDEAAAGLIRSGELSALLHEIVAIDGESEQRSLRESFQARPDIDARAMRSYRATTETQLRERKAAQDGFIQWGVHRSAAVAAYVDHQNEAIEPMLRRLALLDEILARIG